MVLVHTGSYSAVAKTPTTAALTPAIARVRTSTGLQDSELDVFNRHAVHGREEAPLIQLGLELVVDERIATGVAWLLSQVPNSAPPL